MVGEEKYLFKELLKMIIYIIFIFPLNTFTIINYDICYFKILFFIKYFINRHHHHNQCKLVYSHHSKGFLKYNLKQQQQLQQFLKN